MTSRNEAIEGHTRVGTASIGVAAGWDAGVAASGDSAVGKRAANAWFGSERDPSSASAAMIPSPTAIAAPANSVVGDMDDDRVTGPEGGKVSGAFDAGPSIGRRVVRRFIAPTRDRWHQAHLAASRRQCVLAAYRTLRSFVEKIRV